MKEEHRYYVSDAGYRIDATNKLKELKEQAIERCYDEQGGKSEEAYMDLLYPGEHDEYLVNGAMLKCDKATPDVKVLRGKVYNVESPKEETELNVTENSKAMVCQKFHATTFDREIGTNIQPFHCNCSIPPHNDTEWEKLESDSQYMEKGTCGALMKLNWQWDNMPAERPYMQFSDNRFGEKSGITMTSMLFCQHGGIITPVTSGQHTNAAPGLILIYEKEEGAVVSGGADESGLAAQAGQPVKYGKTNYLSKDQNYGKETPQYYLVNYKDAYVDENNLLRISKMPGSKADDDYYCIAMAQGFTTAAEEYCIHADPGYANYGYRMQIILSDAYGNDYSMDVVVAEAKASNNKNDFYPHDHIVEFFVDGKPGEAVSTGGNVNFDKLFGGSGLEVSEVYAYDNGAMIVGTEWPPGQGHWEDRE